MMDICLSGLPQDGILAYLDDIVVFSSSFEIHMNDLEDVFKRLRAANVSLKLSKCKFATDNVDFLGYNLSVEGIKPQEFLTESIFSFQKPTNKKEVKQFLGLSGFYRSFIRKFSEISQPLRKLTSANVKFVWDDKCEIAFSRLKNLLSSEPVLAFPDPNFPFIIEADAGQYSVGGVLSQRKEDGYVHPIAYFSRSLSAIEQKWSTYTQEAYALVLAT